MQSKSQIENVKTASRTVQYSTVQYSTVQYSTIQYFKYTCIHSWMSMNITVSTVNSQHSRFHRRSEISRWEELLTELKQIRTTTAKTVTSKRQAHHFTLHHVEIRHHTTIEHEHAEKRSSSSKKQSLSSCWSQTTVQQFENDRGRTRGSHEGRERENEGLLHESTTDWKGYELETTK